MLPVKEYQAPPAGEHKGMITAVQHRTTEQGYEYTDIEIELLDIEGVTLKTSCPTNVSRDKEGNPKSKLATILKNLGVDLSADAIDEQSIVGEMVKFVTFNKEVKDKGEYAEIVTESIEITQKKLK